MRTVIKTEGIVCDCCGITLTDSGIRTNGGRFEEPFLVHGEIDLCYSCAGKIFYREVSKKVPEQTLKDWIEDLRVKESSTPLMLMSQEIKSPLEENEDLMNGMFKVHSNSIMFQDEHNDLVKPTKSTSSLDQVSRLEDL